MMLSMETDGFTPWMAQTPLFEATFNLVSCALALLDGQGRVLKINGAFAELLGYSLPEIADGQFKALIHGLEEQTLQTIDEQGLQACFAGRTVELRYQRKDGGLLHGRSQVSAVGELLLVEIVPHEAAQSLDRSMEQNQWLQRIVETAPGIIGIFRLGADGGVSMPWASPGYEEYYGLTADELMRDATLLFERIHPEDVARVQASIQASARTLSAWQCEYRVRHPIKGEIWLEGRSRPMLEADGSIIWFGFLHDISERKRIELALLKSEERLSLLDFALSHVHEAAFLIDRQARLRYVNDEACRSLGFSRAELLGMTLAEIDPDWTNEQILADWNDAPGRPPEIIESRHRTRDGRVFAVEISITYLEIDGQSYSLELARDISERERLFTAQQESEKRYREVFDNSSDCLFLLEVRDNQQFCYIEVNTAFERTSGLDRQQLIGRGLGEVVPDAGSKVMAGLMNCLARGEIVDSEADLELPAGRVCVHITFVPVRDERGNIYRIVGVSRDISERKRMESQLLVSEQQFRALAENSLNLIVRYDLNGRRTYVNPAFERETGISSARALQMCLEERWTASMPVAKYRALLRKVVLTGEPQQTVLEWPGQENGEVSVHAVQIIAERDADGAVVSVLAKGYNITALKRHERLEEARLGVFEHLARGAPLTDILALVTGYIERVRPDFLTGIMMVSDDGRYLTPGAAPSLPPEYLRALGCIEIGEGSGICGTAAWRGATVVAEDLGSHPYCAAFREQSSNAGLRACWSEPIKDSVGNLLGTFCIFLRQPRLPTDQDLKLIHQASHLASIAIERKRAETLLLESEQRYREIFDNSPDCMFLLETAGEGGFRIIEVNPVLERKLDKDRAELLGRTIEQSLSPSAVAAAASIARYRKCVDSGVSIDEEVEYDLSTGREIFHLTLIPIRTAHGRAQRVVGICRNITERKHAERVLHAREQEFRALVENTPDVIARYDARCRLLYVNPVAQSILGRPQSYLLGKTLCEASPFSSAVRAFQRKLEEVIQTGQANEAEFTLGTPVAHGTEASCYQVRIVPELDQHGGLVSILAVGRDVSAWRDAERRLKESHAQLRLLSSRRETAREEERKHIAREIHDELGQQLSALRMGISLLRLQFGADQPLLVERVQALMVRVDETIQVVRNVASSLRPSALNMGLTSALEWLVSEFSQNTGIDCRLSAPSARLRLDDERSTAIFRVIQESLTNVCRHAQASRVDIHLEQDAEHLQIEVRDNGKGFDPVQLPKGTLGMLGMRERGHMVGGTVTIDSTPGQGARVRVNIPFQAGPAFL